MNLLNELFEKIVHFRKQNVTFLKLLTFTEKPTPYMQQIHCSSIQAKIFPLRILTTDSAWYENIKELPLFPRAGNKLNFRKLHVLLIYIWLLLIFISILIKPNVCEVYDRNVQRFRKMNKMERKPGNAKQKSQTK